MADDGERVCPAGGGARDEQLRRQRPREEHACVANVREQRERVRQAAQQRRHARALHMSQPQPAQLAAVELGACLGAALGLRPARGEGEAQPRQLDQLKRRVAVGRGRDAVDDRPEQHVRQILHAREQRDQLPKWRIGLGVERAEQTTRLFGFGRASGQIERHAPHDGLAAAKLDLERVDRSLARHRSSRARIGPVSAAHHHSATVSVPTFDAASSARAASSRRVAVLALAGHRAVGPLPEEVLLEERLWQQPAQKPRRYERLHRVVLCERARDDDRCGRVRDGERRPGGPVWRRHQRNRRRRGGKLAEAVGRVGRVLEAAQPAPAVLDHVVHVHRRRLPQHHQLLERAFVDAAQQRVLVLCTARSAQMRCFVDGQMKARLRAQRRGSLQVRHGRRVSAAHARRAALFDARTRPSALSARLRSRTLTSMTLTGLARSETVALSGSSTLPTHGLRLRIAARSVGGERSSGIQICTSCRAPSSRTQRRCSERRTSAHW
eukprot:3283310-Pleurochrysis_carterae.AAC.1